MDVKIVLSREKKYWQYGPCDKVEGKVIIINPLPVSCLGIQVSLEAIVRVSFQDPKGKHHTRTEDAITPSISATIWPARWSWGLASAKDEYRHHLLPASKHVLPFTFQYPSYPLPGSYCSQYGSVKHQITVYLLKPLKTYQLSYHLICYKDYLNLLDFPLPLKPINFQRKKKSFLFSLTHPTESQPSPISFSFKMTQRGFLPGDYAPFKLTLVNFTGKRVMRIAVCLIQKVTYQANNKVKKTSGSILDETETIDLDVAVETIWESGFYIPENVKPTHYRSCIQHQYFAKVQVFMKASLTKPTLKGHTPIIIGTSIHDQDCSGSENLRSSIGHGDTSLSDIVGLLEPDAASVSINHDIVVSPPPSYSALSSRTPSIDNFLPLYEDAMHNHYHREEGQRKKSEVT